MLQKGGNFQTGEQGWVLIFPVSEGAGSWGLHTSLSIDEVCKVQNKCTIYPSKSEDKFVVQGINYFNNVIDGESCMESFTIDQLIDLIELISIE